MRSADDYCVSLFVTLANKFEEVLGEKVSII